MSRADCLCPAPALGDPAGDGRLVCAGLYAELGYGDVLGFVQFAFVTADGYTGDLGK